MQDEEYIYNPLYFIIAYIEHDYNRERCEFDRLFDFMNVARFEGGLK